MSPNIGVLCYINGAISNGDIAALGAAASAVRASAASQRFSAAILIFEKVAGFAPADSRGRLSLRALVAEALQVRRGGPWGLAGLARPSRAPPRARRPRLSFFQRS